MEQKTVGRTRSDQESVEATWCEGYRLLDPLGQTLGRVERIFCNGAGDPQYVRARTGLLGRTLVLIPVLDVAVDAELKSITLR